ncbi:MAG TPA: ethanolamine ammonia-lyase subunit EutC [Pseudomonadales bacterium]|nr:ethanolamine ammonia-lyase subunit EutC [Pseudomonadales bacterium]
MRAFTSARIAIGRTGVSLPTEEILKFGLAHAKARDAVHTPLNESLLKEQLEQAGFDVQCVRSQADSRSIYLQRPDLGRSLAEACRPTLQAMRDVHTCIVVADGLSALAVQSHALPVLTSLREQLSLDWKNTPVVIAQQGRVAIGDDIGEALNAQLVILLIGERPGLSSPDSLGAYITFAPRRGRTDAERNCISNIRPEGLPYAQAAFKIKWICDTALQLRLTGVSLKDESDLIKLN